MEEQTVGLVVRTAVKSELIEHSIPDNDNMNTTVESESVNKKSDSASSECLPSPVPQRPSSRSGAESSPEPPLEMGSDLALPGPGSTDGTGTLGTGPPTTASGSTTSGRRDTPIDELLQDDEDASLEPVMVTLDITRKQCPSLVVEGFKFTRSRSSHAGPSTFWRCSKRSCRATATSWGDDQGLIQVKSVRMVHNHPPPEPAEFFMENAAMQPAQQQMVRISRTLDPPRGAGRKRPASSVPSELLDNMSSASPCGPLTSATPPAARIARRKSGGAQRNTSGESGCSNLSTNDDATGAAGGSGAAGHAYGSDYQLNFALNPPVFGPPVARPPLPPYGSNPSSCHNSPAKPLLQVQGAGQCLRMPTAVTHPITAHLLGQEEPHKSALMQPIQGHAPTHAPLKETAKPSPLKPVAPITGSAATPVSSATLAAAERMLADFPLQNASAPRPSPLPMGVQPPPSLSPQSAAAQYPAHLLRMWSELGGQLTGQLNGQLGAHAQSMLQGQLAPILMQQLQQAAMSAAMNNSGMPISVFNPPRDAAAPQQAPKPPVNGTLETDESRSLDEEWAYQRNRLLMLVAEIMRWAAENFGASPRLARINTNFSSIIESIAKAD